MADRKRAKSNGRQAAEQTAGTSEVSETELSEMKVDELRAHARQRGVGGVSTLKKAELVEAVKRSYQERTDSAGKGDKAGKGGKATKSDKADKSTRSDKGDSGDEGDGRPRIGSETSKSVKYSQQITTVDDEPERPGRSLVTTSHDVIRQWAEERDAKPATVPGTEHGDHLGVLRFDFPGYGGDDLEEVSWDDWFGTFDARRLNFIYQAQRSGGEQSNFFILESPDREDG